MLRRSKTEKARVAAEKAATEQATDAEPPAEADDGPDPGGGAHVRSVLVVSDDAGTCELLARVMDHTGAHTLRADDGPSTLDALGHPTNDIGAVVLDFTSGTASSFTVLESIRERDDLGDPTVMIIATTTANRALAFESGVDEFLTRPFHVDEFTSAVGAMLARTPDEREAYRADQAGPPPPDVSGDDGAGDGDRIAPLN